MSRAAIACSRDGGLNWTREGLIASARQAFPGIRVTSEDRLTLEVPLPSGDGTSRFLDLSKGEVRYLSTDASYEQQLRFGAWVASLIPEGATGQAVLLNHNATVAAYLKPGMTPEDVEAAWHEQPPE